MRSGVGRLGLRPANQDPSSGGPDWMLGQNLGPTTKEGKGLVQARSVDPV
jgi:hypothetical protein